MNVNNRTVWSILWNDNTGANKSQLVDVMCSNHKVPPALSQVTAHIIQYSDSQGPKGAFNAAYEAWNLPSFMILDVYWKRTINCFKSEIMISEDAGAQYRDQTRGRHFSAGPVLLWRRVFQCHPYPPLHQTVRNSSHLTVNQRRHVLCTFIIQQRVRKWW